MRIAISGHSGCGNTTATTNVGKILGLDIMNYTFRDLAKDLGIAFDDVQKESPTNFLYDYLTDLQLIRAALNQKVVVGTRLASWLMEADMRVWLNASLEARAARINKRESEKQSTYEQVLYKTLKRDESNRKRYLQLYGLDINDHSDFDLTINTEKLTAEQVSGLIVAAAQWASNNRLERKNIHLHRIQEIIAENLKLPIEALTDPLYPLDVKSIFTRIRKI
ncbi:MAG: cytidylate kinase family protein [Silvanigrellales bacterium]|jgi:cytidylate kinase|nr:cytidylate kinase family protein [Silvanigrellales bacterium]